MPKPPQPNVHKNNPVGLLQYDVLFSKLKSVNEWKVLTNSGYIVGVLLGSSSNSAQ